MRRTFVDESGRKVLGTEEDAVPVCGEDFCDSCGDCLSCYGSDGCPDSNWGDHYWVVYLEDEGDVAEEE